MMRKLTCILLAFLTAWGTACAQERSVRIRVVQTSDVHGNFYPYDFIRKGASPGSLARLSTLVNEQRKEYGKNLLLLDNGDILQGQPAVYYYNYIDTLSVHLAARMLNYLHYDVGCMGNHDVETGRGVFERWASQCEFPILGANIVDQESGLPIFKPYEILERDGVKIAVLGMVTPAIPVWLPEMLWKGLSFLDMEQAARYWMKIIREKEQPDVVIGLFHAGSQAETLGQLYRENASIEIAQRIPGFDALLIGHDHTPSYEWVTNVVGKRVLVLNPGSNARMVSLLDLEITMDGDGVIRKQMDGKLIPLKELEPDEDFLTTFSDDYRNVSRFVERRIGSISRTLSARDAYFGPSYFMELIHHLQLAISGADISFAAPLSNDSEICKGDIMVSDMFTLYKYENQLYTMLLTGQEIKDALEMSYALWSNRMKKADDHLLLLKESQKGKSRIFHLANQSFNFDSAAGINYTVDVTQPKGKRVLISSLSDGRPFDLKAQYRVAVNSYRGNGGGNLLTEGAGIPKQELAKRILTATDKDLRYYLMKYIENHPNLVPQKLNNWKFVPEAWTVPAARRDYQLLFPYEITEIHN